MDSKRIAEIAKVLSEVAEKCPQTTEEWYQTDCLLSEFLSQPQWEAYQLGQLVGMQYEKSKHSPESEDI